MHTVLSQVQKAKEAGLYYVALISALSVPDIAGALESQDGRASRKRYIAWYKCWVQPRLRQKREKDNPFSGEACYSFRCSMLHQGRSQRQGDAYTKIMFIEPGYPNYQMHYVQIGGAALLIQVDEFIDEIVTGCELWLAGVKGTELFKKNYATFARRHPAGLAPYVNGVPVIG
jgi:hypothetical protein